MKRVLFVDDEPQVLDGIRRALRRERDNLEMAFATNGEEALAMCAETPFDIVVSDMRMPGMSGAQLLEQLHERHPTTARFILSGYAEVEAVMRTVPVAHQYLTKPCQSEGLKDQLFAACELQELLHDKQLLEVIGEVDSLPSRPECYSRVLEAIANPETTLASVAATIETDAAISGKLLQLANSSFFGVAEEITSVEQATGYLGLNTIGDLVLSIEVFRSQAGCSPEIEKIFEESHLRSTRTATLARGMFASKKEGAPAFTAGILHDVGTLILAAKLPEKSLEVNDAAAQRGVPICVVEREILGVTHGEIGAHLLGLWGLPYPMLTAAAYHHSPSEAPPSAFNELAAVHVACALIETRSPEIQEGAATTLDTELLEALGVLDQLDTWQELADETMQGGNAEGAAA